MKSTTHDERYVHLQGVIEDVGFPALFIQGHICHKYRGGTAFCRKESDGWYVAVSLCWQVDQFNRKTGRQNARRHYFTNQQKKGRMAEYLGAEFDYEQVLDVIARRIMASEQHNQLRKS